MRFNLKPNNYLPNFNFPRFLWLKKIPDLFRLPAFGLDISDYSIEAIAFKGPSLSPQLLGMSRIVLEPGIVENGLILDKAKLKTFLKRITENPDFGEIKSKRVIFTVPESRIFVHIFDLPDDLKVNQQLEFITAEVKQSFPYELKDIYFDFKIKEGKPKEVILVACPKDIVNNFLEVIKSAGFKVEAVGIESQSLGQALVENKTQVTLISDIGARTTNFSLFEDGYLRFSDTIEVAGDRFTKALAEKLTLPLSKAELIKREIGLDPAKKEGRVFLVLQKEIRIIIEEISNIEHYFQRKEGKGIDNIILTGGSAVLPHLKSYLADNLNKPVSIGDPWEKINIDILKKKEYIRRALRVNPILYSTAIGSALTALDRNRQKYVINFLSKKEE